MSAAAAERERASLVRVARCADGTWAADPRDPFLLANQRIWSQHCRVSRALQLSAVLSQEAVAPGPTLLTDDPQDGASLVAGGACARRSVRDIIPESRLALYGTFYYDEDRERCYASDAAAGGGGCGLCGDSSDLMECWMLPQVGSWFSRLTEDGATQRRDALAPSSKEQFERWDAAEAALWAGVRRARHLWPPDAEPAPPVKTSPPLKMRVRRHTALRAPRCPHPQPDRPVYCPESPRPLCDARTQIRFDVPAQRKVQEIAPRVVDPKVISRPPLSRKVQSRPARGRSYECRQMDGASRQRRPRAVRTECSLPPIKIAEEPSQKLPDKEPEPDPPETKDNTASVDSTTDNKNESPQSSPRLKLPPIEPPKEVEPSATEDASTEKSTGTEPPLELPNINQKRLYSTVLSAGPPPPIIVTSVGRLRLPQGLVRLSSKLAFPAIPRKPPIDTKFEELEREALEQYKPSDESIDSKYRALEKQAMDQYSGTSNSNTSCSSGQSSSGQCAAGQSGSEQSGCEQAGTGKCSGPRCGTHCDGERTACAATEKSELTSVETSCSNQGLDDAKKSSVKEAETALSHACNFPDLAARGCTSSSIDLKNVHAPPRGEKKEVNHRQGKGARCKPAQRTASDTEDVGRTPLRWTLHVIPPKRRNEHSSDEEESREPKSKEPGAKERRVAQVKMSAHGGGDLHPAMRKTS